MKLPNQLIGTVDRETLSSQKPPGSFSVVVRLSALLAFGVAGAVLYWQFAYLQSLKGGISEYIIVFLAQFSLYLAACYLVTRDNGSLWSGGRWSKVAGISIILLVAASVRAELVPQTPYLSTDVYRYIWDGRVQASGINPYRYLPSDPELAHLRDDDIYGHINRRDFAHTIYPPAAQAIFLGINLFSSSNVPAFKIAMSIFDLAAIAAIMLALRRSGLPPVYAIVYAWHPLPVWESAHSGHIESAAIAFLAAALLAWSYEKPLLTGVALALATLVKFYPALLLPVFMFSSAAGPGERAGQESRGARLRAVCLSRPNLQMLAAFFATVVLAYLPYLTVGSGVTGYLEGYLREEGFVDSGQRYFVLGVVHQVVNLPVVVYMVFAALVLAAFALRTILSHKRNAADVARFGAWMVGLFVLLTSPRFSWYMAWIIPFLCFVPRAGWLYLSGASVLLYLVWLADEYPGVPLWLGAALYVPDPGPVGVGALEAAQRDGERVMSSETVPRSPAVEQPISYSPHRGRVLAYILSAPAALVVLGLTSAWLYFWAGDLHRFTQWIAAYESLFVAQFAIYLAACYAVMRPPNKLSRNASVLTVAIVLVFAAGFRAELIGKRPYLSTDVYRYLWDGRVQVEGINPYRYVPPAPELAEIRDENIYPKINSDYAITPYPPMAEMIYAAIYWIKPSSVTGFKLAMSVFDLLAMLALVLVLARAGLEPARVVMFAWNPLLIFEAAHSGHIESAFICFLVLALLAWSYRRPSLTGVGLGLATMVKFYPALLLPVFLIANNDPKDDPGKGIRWRQLSAGLLTRFNLVLCAAFVLTIAVCYAPYLSVGAGVLGSLGSEFRTEGFVEKGGRYFLLALSRKALPLSTTAFLILAGLLLAGTGVWWLLRQKKNEIDVARGALALIGPYLLITSPRYPWHYAWLIPYLCFAPRVGWIYLSGATVLLYLLWYTPLEYPDVPLWLGAAVYIPAMAFLVWEWWKGRTNDDLH